MSEAREACPASHQQEPGFAVYRTINERLVALADLQEGDRVLDLGAGSGALSSLILSQSKAEVIAADPDEHAVRKLHDLFQGLDVRRAGAATLSDVFPPQSFSRILMANAIHLVTDLPRAFREIYTVLQPKGRFLFSTTHFLGGESACDGAFYWSLLLNAKRIAANIAGVPNVPPPPLRASPGTLRRPRSYREAIRNSPLRYVADDIIRVTLDRQVIRSIATSLDFATRVLPEYPPPVALAALRSSCDALLSAGRALTIERSWYLTMSDRAAREDEEMVTGSSGTEGGGRGRVQRNG